MRADLRRIDHALRDQRVDAGQHVPGVADAEVADVERAELLAVAGAAAIVRLEHEHAARHPDVDRIDRAGERDGARRRRSARRESRPAADTSSTGSKSAGLCRTPSIVAPSWLFHDTTSSVLAVQLAVCAFMSVSFLRSPTIHLGHRLRARSQTRDRLAVLRQREAGVDRRDPAPGLSRSPSTPDPACRDTSRSAPTRRRTGRPASRRRSADPRRTPPTAPSACRRRREPSQSALFV